MHVAFDADDTLWHNEPYYSMTQERVWALLADWADGPRLEERILEIERRNLRIYGYGFKGFTLSLIETALEVAGDDLPASVVREILARGQWMAEHPIELLPGVEETVRKVAEDHPVMCVTKGDLFHQETKVAASGLADVFSAVEIVSEKDPETYRRLLERHGIAPERFVMVGNSVRSDVLPVVEIGGNAILVHYATTWELEQVAHRGAETEGFLETDSIADVPALLEKIAARGWD